MGWIELGVTANADADADADAVKGKALANGQLGSIKFSARLLHHLTPQLVS
jgi:hypothetical protein